jgi:hypothetical protein
MKKVGLLFIALIVAMGLCGVGYAHGNNNWGHKDKKIELWDCRVVFESASSNDPGVTIDPGYDKHVASTEASIGETDNNLKNCCCLPSCLPTRNLIITVNNAYPCYESTVDYTIKAMSQCMCAELSSININGIELTPQQAGQLVDLGAFEVTVNPPQTIMPCNSEDGDITIHIKQSAAQCHTYQFAVTMYYQFKCCNGNNDDHDDHCDHDDHDGYGGYK